MIAVRAQALDGAWETIGTGRLRGVVPEALTFTANGWGPDTCSFQLKTVDPAAQRPDLLAFTPLEVEIDGAVVWAGRVMQRPGDDIAHQVSCEGWQYHLDDDELDRVYVHSRLTEWRDQRSFLAADLTYYTAGGRTETGGAISLVWPDNYVADTGIGQAATLDLGPDSLAKRVTLTWERIGSSTGDLTFLVRCNDSANANVAGQDVYTSTLTTASATSTVAVTTARRYVHLILAVTTAPHTFAGDQGVRISKLILYADAAYETGDASILKASDVVKDARNRAAPLLNQTDALITSSTFSLPEYETGGYITPRAAIEQVNVYEAYQPQIAGADLRTLRYRVKPTVAVLEIGDWSGVRISDASIDGREIFNGAIVDATGPDGNRLVAKRATGNLSGSQYSTTALVQPSNPGFETDTSGWSILNSASITRDTTIFDQGVASGRVGSDAVGGSVYASSMTASFVPGLVYRLVCRLRKTATLAVCTPVATLSAGSGGSAGSDVSGSLSTSAFTTITFDFQAVHQTMWVGFVVAGSSPSDVLYIDAMQLLVVGRSLADRRQFTRRRVIPVRSGVTQTVAERFADLWLADHVAAPFSASVQITGPDACRHVLTGQPVPAHLIPLYVGEKLRLGHRVDPDTGALGRDGRIVAATYDAASDVCGVTLDDRRESFDRVLARYGLLVGLL